jgi:hypothetical protein
VRWRFWRRRPPPYDWLRVRTGMDGTEWVLWIQEQISTSWQPNPDDPKHPISWPAADWQIPLVEEVERRVLERTRGGDENIGTAQVLAMILATWSARIARAKAMDPHRPVSLRRQAYRAFMAFVSELHYRVTDESADAAMFDQPWENPHLPEATDGDFV